MELDPRYRDTIEAGRRLNISRLIRIVLVAAASAYLTIVATVYFRQEALLFNPDPARLAPNDVGIRNAEVEEIITPDGEKLVAWYTAAAPGKPTILFLHGKGGSIANRPKRYAYYTGQGYGLLFLSWRGYGGSTGTPSEPGLIADAVAAYDWLLAHGVPASGIVAVGESLGTGIAVELAARVPLGALALESPYVSMVEVARSHYWWLPVGWLIKNPINAGAAIDKYPGPILMQHGDQDETIPIAIGRALYDRARGPKQFVVIPGAGHFIYTEEVFAREIAFFDKALRRQ